MIETKTAKLEVTLTAIDGKHLVLEDTKDKSKIYWPIENLAGQINIGNKLTLELKEDKLNNQFGPNLGSSNPTNELNSNTGYSNDEDSSKARMRKLLESLVN